MIGLAVTTSPATAEVTAAEKKAFIDLVKTLPRKGELFTDAGIRTAAPHTRVLLALTEQDLAPHDLYPFLALSRGLLDRKDQRAYGMKHFSTIAHPTIKLFWGGALFDAKAVSPEIVSFLRSALAADEPSKTVAEMMGPQFDDFKKRVMAAPSLTFAAFPVEGVFQGAPARPALASHPRASTYRTALRARARRGPDFAGHYTVVQIGCGTGCALIALVDAETGKVFFPAGLRQVHWAGWWHEPHGPEYRVSSRLLLVHGQANDEAAEHGIWYFEWTGNDFRLLGFGPRDRGKPPR